MPRVKFTNHAMAKIEILQNHGFFVDADLIKACLIAPAKIEAGRGKRKIAQMVYDEGHVLRVVYEERENEILVVTVYPGRRTRYEKDQV
ncbi:DUF4258 domain-containing protein [Desulfofundulus thermocisternus]|uniref:DUF4258 domain-containing protein n=1 Tax=Desulfofundulus thermocisternus TaxID=42471 RepID=UPI0019EEEEF3|nr:DUF4258 domain-containing protein [Desulfofundulus thermocisternus]MBE3586851.1 DUF4258 domain-containing protein [Thermoanaerobacter sp.]MCS5695460.1 DUF4258 domain-containing protein [Desulfofundulus thermocisternus]